jgi:hypothetical protein
VLVQAPKSDIFVAMLGVAAGAILLSCLLMLLILWRYDFKTNAKLAARGQGIQSQGAPSLVDQSHRLIVA